jgi:putative membrane protein
MERKLYNFIMMPAMLLSWLFGVLLIHSLGFEVFTELWMQIKTISVSNFNLLSFFTWKIS